MRMNVPAKLGLAFVSIIAAVALTSWTTLRGIDSIAWTTVNKLQEDTIPGLDQIGRMAYLTTRIRGDFWRFVHFEDPNTRTTIAKAIANEREGLTKVRARYDKSITRDEDRRLFEDLNQHLAAYLDVMDRAFAAIATKDATAFKDLTAKMAQMFTDDIEPRLDTLIEKNSTWALEACAANLAVAAEVRSGTRLGLLVTIGLSLAAAGLLCWSILPRLAACRRSVEAMARGSLDDGLADDARARLASGRDELGDIARSVASLRTYMSDMSTTANLIASGDLRAQPKVRGASDVLGNAFTAMGSSLRTSMDTISQSAQTLAGASEELSAASTQLDGNATEAATRTQAIAAASEEVNRGIQSVASAAEEMSTSVKEISSQTQSMAGKVGQAADAAQAMSTATKNVDEIAATIASIAEQTNLLALNATIEAARAGEAGRGFAVVAGEVKALAGQTAEATRHITAILSELRAHMQTVAAGTGEVRDATSAVASAVEEQNATTAEIGRNMSEAARGSQEIATSITVASTAVAEARQGAAQVREAAGSLARIATELQQAVAGFRI